MHNYSSLTFFNNVILNLNKNILSNKIFSINCVFKFKELKYSYQQRVQNDRTTMKHVYN